MITDIRGALGTQIISLASRPGTTRIHLNIGGNIHPLGTYDYLSELIAGCPPVTKILGMSKVPISEWDKAIECAPRLRIPRAHRGGAFLHIRSGNLEPSSAEAYTRMPKHLQVIGNGPYARGSAVLDWLTIVAADEVYSSMTTFTLSAAMCNPALQLYIMEPDGPILPPASAIEATRRLTAKMPNVKWMQP